MFGGEQANLHVGRTGKDLGLQVKEFRFPYNIYWYNVNVGNSRFLALLLILLKIRLPSPRQSLYQE